MHCLRRRSARRCSRRWRRLQGAPGRLERVGETRGAPIFVDYAHKPDALEKALAALRPFVSGRLIVVFGCGGDRDPRQAADDGRDRRRATPTSSSSPTTIRAARTPAAIRAAILAAAPGAREIGDRARGDPRRRSRCCSAGDALVIAGKGHETGQIVGDRTLPFSDADSVRGGAGGGRMSAAVVDARTNWPACSARRARRSPQRRDGRLDRHAHACAAAISSSPSRATSHDGHDHVARAFAAGRRGCAWSLRARAGELTAHGAGLRGRRHACARWSGWAQRRARAQRRAHRGGDRLGRQDQRQGDAAARAARESARRMPRPRPTTIIGACR